MILIDGNIHSGSGCILRHALALSHITKKPFKIINIRQQRKKPGIKKQHLAAIKFFESHGSITKGAELGGLELEFIPSNTIKKGKYEIDIETAGSIGLVIQSILLPLIYENKNYEIKIIGGTDVFGGPPIDYTKNVLFPYIRKYTKTLDLKIEKRGFMPKGGGIVELQVKGMDNLNSKNPIVRSKVKKNLIAIKGNVVSSKNLSSKNISERIANSATNMLKNANETVNITTTYQNSDSDGCVITTYAMYGTDEGFDYVFPKIIGVTELGQLRVTSEKIGETVAKELMKLIEKDISCDPLLADQLIPFLGIVGGEITTTEITDHIESTIFVTETFLDCKFEIIKDEINSTVTIKTTGNDENLVKNEENTLSYRDL